MYQIGDIVTVENPGARNQVGGSTRIEGKIQAKITDTWNDYETGQRYIGEITNEEDIEVSKNAGKVNFTPEDYKKYGREHYLEAKKAFKSWDPTKIYFGEFDNITKEA